MSSLGKFEKPNGTLRTFGSAGCWEVGRNRCFRDLLVPLRIRRCRYKRTARQRWSSNSFKRWADAKDRGRKEDELGKGDKGETYPPICKDTTLESPRVPIKAHALEDGLKTRIVVCPSEEFLADPR